MVITHYNFLENTKPRKEDFQVYESASKDPEYKEYKGIVYNDHMFREALDFYEYRENGPSKPCSEGGPKEGEKVIFIDDEGFYEGHWNEHDIESADRWCYPGEEFTKWQKHRYLGGENELYKGWRHLGDKVFVKRTDKLYLTLSFGKYTDLMVQESESGRYMRIAFY